MKRKRNTALSVVEIPYGDIGWGVSLTHEWAGIRSNIQHWKKYRELDDYQLSGVYAKAGIPYEIDELVYDGHENEEVYLSMARQVSQKVARHLKKGNCVLITGGYCRDAVGICGGIQKAFGADVKIGIIYLDAHSDMSCPEWTASGILGGMDLHAIMGLGMHSWREAAELEVPVAHGNILLGDFREYGSGCDNTAKLLENRDFVWVDPTHFSDGTTFRTEVAALAQRVDVIYLHIDEDILDKRDAPNAWCLSELAGPTMEVMKEHIRTVMQTGKVVAFSMLDVYFEDATAGQEVATLNAIRLIGTGLSCWKEIPDIWTLR